VGLTDKEKTVLQLRSEGLTQIEVAKRLKISQAAVSDFEKNGQLKFREAQETIEFMKSLKGVRK
jgi:transcriptional regulator